MPLLFLILDAIGKFKCGNMVGEKNFFKCVWLNPTIRFDLKVW